MPRYVLKIQYFTICCRYGGEIATANHGATESEIEETAGILKMLNNNEEVDVNKLKKSFKDFPKIKDFFDKHCHTRHYNFQVLFCLVLII